MQDSSSTVTSIQKLIKKFQRESLQQLQKTHAEPLLRIHQIMRDNGLTPEMVALSFKTRKPRTKKEVIEPRATLKLPVTQKKALLQITIRTHQRVGYPRAHLLPNGSQGHPESCCVMLGAGR